MKYACLLLVLIATGCAPAPKIVQTPPAPSIAELLQQHRYLSALKTLNANAPNASDATQNYTEQRDAILTAARDYQSGLIRELSELLQQQQFAQAQQRLENAQAELPISRELDQLAEQLYSAKDRYQRRYLEEILQLRSGSLLKERQLYQALQKSATDTELQQLIARQRDDSEFFARQLAESGNRALSQGDYAKAVNYLGLANQLAPSAALAQQLKRSEQAFAASKQKQQNVRSAEREQRYRELSTLFQQSLQQRDYAAARAQLDQLRALNIHGDEVDATQRELDNSISNFVKLQIEAGNRFYSEGRIEDALQRWRQAQALAPSVELTERIDKAQRFIERLEQLRRQR